MKENESSRRKKEKNIYIFKSRVFIHCDKIINSIAQNFYFLSMDEFLAFPFSTGLVVLLFFCLVAEKRTSPINNIVVHYIYNASSSLSFFLMTLFPVDENVKKKSWNCTQQKINFPSYMFTS